MKGQKTLFSKASDEYRTPKELFRRLNIKFNFEMDLAATRENALCDVYFTKEKSALTNELLWGVRNFCNPPYSIWGSFAQEADRQSTLFSTLTVMLLPARTDTKAFHDFIYNKWHVEFIQGRLKFSNCKNSAPFPSMLVYFGIKA